MEAKIRKFIKTFENSRFEMTDEKKLKEFNSFSTKFRNILKELANRNGLEIVNYNKGWFYISAFIKNNAGKHVYISISDVRYDNSWIDRILIRTAQHEKDYTGGGNNYTSLNDIEKNVLSLLER